jgi:uncharacterized Fe-S cluster protein YjdI
MTRRTYRGTDVEVSFDGDLCIHATECVRGLPAVFDRKRRPWVLADNATVEEVSAVIERCPSGALQYRRLDGAPNEPAGPVTTVTPSRTAHWRCAATSSSGMGTERTKDSHGPRYVDAASRRTSRSATTATSKQDSRRPEQHAHRSCSTSHALPTPWYRHDGRRTARHAE